MTMIQKSNSVYIHVSGQTGIQQLFLPRVRVQKFCCHKNHLISIKNEYMYRLDMTSIYHTSKNLAPLIIQHPLPESIMGGSTV